jgi:hypothetical protein
MVAIAPAPRPAFALTNCSGGDPAIDSAEQAFLGLINDYRQDNGLSPLSLSSSLNRAAAWKANDMATRDYFEHDDLSGRSWVDRIRDCGYTANTYIGENMAAGNQPASGAFDQWRNSSGHNENMLGDDYVVIGIGRAHDANATYGWYWVTDFGGQADGAPPPPSSSDGNGDVDCNGRTDTIDATLVLQRDAGVTGALACGSDADVNRDNAVTPIDAVLILQFSAGLILSLPV